jgi:glycosyltransferase involved in cell wall biosynthesis
MGKKKTKKSPDTGQNVNDVKRNNLKLHLPSVSICTPTFNRRPFFEYTIKCYLHQDYPRDKIEWIIIDDGTDKIEDLVINIPGVKYFKYDTKMTLGKKRNLMHEKSSGDILVYMDDDDYYPPERVSHAVNMLQSHPSALCAGASEIYIYFKHIDKMYQFGPYGPNHATAGTFAFKRKLLETHKYNENAALAEEKEFLKNYTVPFVQLEPKKTILVFSHRHNTFDKKKLLEQPDNQVQKPSDKTVSEFVKDPDFKDFYMNKIESLLVNYKPGEPDMKPDVLKQIQEIDAERKRRTEEIAKANSGQITITKDGKNIPLSNEQIVNILKQQQSQMQELTNIIRQKDMEIENLNKRLEVVTVQHELHSDNLKRVLSMLIERDQEIKDLRANIQNVDHNQISTTQENIVLKISNTMD